MLLQVRACWRYCLGTGNLYFDHLLRVIENQYFNHVFIRK